MKITADLKLVVPIYIDESGAPILQAYHVPISREVFEANYRIISATHAAIFDRGAHHAAITGPVIARLRMKDEGMADARMNNMTGDGGVDALFAEIKRLTTILAPCSTGWDMLPVDTAIMRKDLEPEDWDEVLSKIVFFTCAYAMVTRQRRNEMAGAIAGMLAGSITSSSLTEFVAGLPRSTVAVPSIMAASSVPS